MKTTEELMKPRYRVLLDYPDSPFEVGQIIDFEKNKYTGELAFNYATDNGIDHYYPTFFNEYPHLFQPLAWWEERNAEDLPEYVKDTIAGKIVVKVHKWGEDHFVSEANAPDLYRSIHMELWTPATEEEYLAYTNSNQ